jgi:hypothetical protein
MLLYLDIDGVMVPRIPWRKPGILEDGFPEFSMQLSLYRITWPSCKYCID